MLKVSDFTRKQKDVAHFAELKKLTEMELRQLQSTLLEMYRDIVEICKKYEITLIACGGTALGAVRHKGFIPWDDDIDSVILREDYDKFIETFKIELSEKYYIAAPIKGEYSYYHIKIINKNTIYREIFDYSVLFPSGIWIDMFILDKVPENIIFRIFKGFTVNIFQFIITSVNIFSCRNKYSEIFFSANWKYKSYYLIRCKIIGRVFSIFSYASLCIIYDRLSTYRKPSRLRTIANGCKKYFGEILPEDVFFPAKEIMFENMTIHIPNNIDKYLIRIYGENYMVIPPVSERQIHSCIIVKFNIKNE
jgi:lipopolysaccharide cholinephosphotransferase